MAITKEMLKRCQNELKQAFCALPDDVQKAMMDNQKYAEFFGCTKEWIGGGSFDFSSPHCAYRLSPDTPTDPEWVERDIKFDGLGLAFSHDDRGMGISLYASVTRIGFLGIIYRDKDGIETLRTSIDAAFGTPVRVHFSKP